MPPARPDGLDLPAAVAAAMLDHAREDPGREACGLVGGRGQRARRYFPVRNVSPIPQRRYLMEPRGQIDAMRRMRETGDELLAIFHSHPRSGARPSATDLARAAYTDTIYLISGPTTGEAELNAWYFDGARFTPIRTRITDE